MHNGLVPLCVSVYEGANEMIVLQWRLLGYV